MQTEQETYKLAPDEALRRLGIPASGEWRVGDKVVYVSAYAYPLSGGGQGCRVQAQSKSGVALMAWHAHAHQRIARKFRMGW